jgi:hypothetical protein
MMSALDCGRTVAVGFSRVTSCRAQVGAKAIDRKSVKAGGMISSDLNPLH